MRFVKCLCFHKAIHQSTNGMVSDFCPLRLLDLHRVLACGPRPTGAQNNIKRIDAHQI